APTRPQNPSIPHDPNPPRPARQLLRSRSPRAPERPGSTPTPAPTRSASSLWIALSAPGAVPGGPSDRNDLRQPGNARMGRIGGRMPPQSPRLTDRRPGGTSGDPAGQTIHTFPLQGRYVHGGDGAS